MFNVHGSTCIFNAVDASLSMTLNHELKPRVFRSVVNSVNARIIYLSLLFFVGVFMIVLKSNIHITYMYLFTLLGVSGKYPHKSK